MKSNILLFDQLLFMQIYQNAELFLEVVKWKVIDYFNRKIDCDLPVECIYLDENVIIWNDSCWEKHFEAKSKGIKSKEV